MRWRDRALTAFELMPRIGLDFVLKHVSDARDPLRIPHAWYVLLELSSPREGDDIARLAETLLGEAVEAKRDRRCR